MAQTSRQGSQDWLSFYASYGDKMSALLQLLYPETDHSELYDLMSSTLTGYLMTLRQVVHQVVRVLVQEGEPFLTTKRNSKSETAGELYKFRQFMKSAAVAPLLKSIDFLHMAHNQVIKSDDFFYNYRCTPLLINVFYDHLMIAAAPQDRTIAWNLFLCAIRPTLFYLDDMLDNGHSVDVSEEFMFDIGTGDVQKDADFWESCLHLKDDQAVPHILKPLISHLTRGIRSRLLLLGSGIESRGKIQKSTFDLFYDEWEQQQTVPPEEPVQVPEAKEVRSETPDSGEGDDLEDHSDSHATENDVNPDVLLSETSAAKSPDSIDEGLGHVVSAAIDFGPGQLKDLPVLEFANITPLDSVYFQNKIQPAQIYNPVLDELPELENELIYSMPDQMRTPIRLAIERALHPVIIARCDAASDALMAAFRDSYIRHLKFHTDYWLLHRDSHSISLYLNKLFHVITFRDEKQMFLFQSCHLDEESDVRACVVYSHKPQDLDAPVKILNRLHIQYQDMEPFARLLLSPQIRQTLADAFHFLIILRYSVWLLCSLNLRFHSNRTIPSDAGDDGIKDSDRHSKHALFCLRFRCLKAVTRLLEFVMFELHDGIVRLEKDAHTCAGFDELRDSLTAFADLVRKTTLADKSRTGKKLTDIVSKAAIKMQEMTVTTDTVLEQVKQVEKIVSLLCDRHID